MSLLNYNGTVVAVGLLGEYKKPLHNLSVAMQRRSVAGSLIGGIAKTQKVLDFCAEHNISPEVQMIKMQNINKALDDLLDKEAHYYYYVIGMQALKEAE